jgi:tetratricopeptide (TPR) repeat protein
MTSAEELQDQGKKLYMQHDYEAAARIFQQAQEAYSAENKQDMVAEMQTNTGLVHRALGEYQQALDIMKDALNIFRDLNDELRAAQVLGNMGGVYMSLNDKEQAYNCYRQAADVFDQLGEKKLYGETMLAIANMQVRDGKIMAGAATYEVGLEQLNELSTSQKVLKGLLGVRNRLLGGAAGPVSSQDNEADT